MHQARKISAIAVLVLVALTAIAADSAPGRSPATDQKKLSSKTSSTVETSQRAIFDLPNTERAGAKFTAPEPKEPGRRGQKPSLDRLPSDVPRAMAPVEPTFGMAIRLPGLAKSPPELPAAQFTPDTRPIGVLKARVSEVPFTEPPVASHGSLAPQDSRAPSSRRPAKRPPLPSVRAEPEGSPMPTTPATVPPAQSSVLRVPAVVVSAKPSAPAAPVHSPPPVKLVLPVEPVTQLVLTDRTHRLALAPLDKVAPPTPPSPPQPEVVSSTPNHVPSPVHEVSPEELAPEELAQEEVAQEEVAQEVLPIATRTAADPIAFEPEFQTALGSNLEVANTVPTFSTGLMEVHPESAGTAIQVQDRTILQEPRLFSHDDQLGNWNGSITWPCHACGQHTCCCHQVLWRARSEALFLHRSRADAFDDFIVECFQTGIGVRADHLGMDFHGGPRFTVIRDNQSGGHDFEGTYYSIDHWTGSDFHSGDLVVRGTQIPGVGVGVVRYESRLQNAELNMTRDVTNWTQFLIGFRWLQLDEFSSINGSTNVVPSIYEDVDVVNDLYGGQLGLRRTLFDRGGYVTIDGWVKSGIYRNKIHRSTTGFGTSPLGKDETSWINELDVLANYEITSSWALNMGYQVMWISNIAQAPDQFFSPNAIFSDENAILHGFRFGITFTH